MIEITTYTHNGAEIDRAEAETPEAALAAAKQLTLDAIAAGEHRPIKAVFRVDGAYVGHVWRAEIDVNASWTLGEKVA